MTTRVSGRCDSVAFGAPVHRTSLNGDVAPGLDQASALVADLALTASPVQRRHTSVHPDQRPGAPQLELVRAGVVAAEDQVESRPDDDVYRRRCAAAVAPLTAVATPERRGVSVPHEDVGSGHGEPPGR